MTDARRRLAEAYDVVRAAGLDAADAAELADESVRQAHDALVMAGIVRNLASAAAKDAARARFLARRASITLGAVLDTLDADEGAVE